MPGFEAAVGGTRAVGGVTVLDVAFATIKLANYDLISNKIFIFRHRF